MTHFPPAAVHEQRRKILRWVGIALSATMVVTVLTVFVLIVRSESAHHEATCPFRALSERAFAGGRVREEERSCVAGVSERRYLLERGHEAAYELARKRLASERFAPARYRWELETDAQGRVVLRSYVDGKLASESREQDAPPR